MEKKNDGENGRVWKKWADASNIKPRTEAKRITRIVEAGSTGMILKNHNLFLIAARARAFGKKNGQLLASIFLSIIKASIPPCAMHDRTRRMCVYNQTANVLYILAL